VGVREGERVRGEFEEQSRRGRCEKGCELG
jgi:hypothetical protein